MADALEPNDNLRAAQRKIGFLALVVAWVAVMAMFFFYHKFGAKVNVQVVLMGVGALAMFIVAARTLSRSRTR